MKLLHNYTIYKPFKATNPEKRQNKDFSEEEKLALINEAIEDTSWLDWEKPQWMEGGNVHNWHNYATPALQAVWDSFTDQQKAVVAAALEKCASQEQWD